jgi:hypothetical protein
MHRDEPALVAEFVQQSAVEPLRIRVLNRLAWIDELQRDATLVRPLIEGLASDLRTIVADDGA